MKQRLYNAAREGTTHEEITDAVMREFSQWVWEQMAWKKCPIDRFTTLQWLREQIEH